MNNRIVNNPLLEWAVKLATWECYLTELTVVPGGVLDAMRYEECLKLNDIDALFNESIYLQGKAVTSGVTEEEQARVAALTVRMEEAWTRVIPYDALQQHPRNCDDDIFFEKLIVFTNRAVLNIQDLVNRAENAVRADLLSRLKPLKKSDQFSANFEEIQEIENRLNIIDEGRNADKVANYLKSEIVDGEKITPHFLRIAKTLSSDSLSRIKKPDGNPFE